MGGLGVCGLLFIAGIVFTITFVVGSLAYLIVKEMNPPHLKHRRTPERGFEVKPLSDDDESGGQ
jgi:hypothetical protein